MDRQNIAVLDTTISEPSALIDKTGRALVPDHNGAGYTQVLKELHRWLSPRTYLEIGTLEGRTLALAQCASIAIDPRFAVRQNVLGRKTACHFFQCTSDDFFVLHSPRQIMGRPIDLAFLDGMHHFEFLLRDFMNTEAHCDRNSMIVMHDCIPTNVWIARRDSADKKYAGRFPHENWWAGDVWKTPLILRKYRPDLKVIAMNAPPTGLIAISNLNPASQLLTKEFERIITEFAKVDLLEFGVERLVTELDTVTTDTFLNSVRRGAAAATS
jgi:hypothetical protein